MSIGIEIIGGGNNKFNRTSINVNGDDSRGIIINNSSDNEFEDTQIFLGSSIEKLKKMQNDIANIQDDSINSETGNKFQDDILSALSDLTRLNEETNVSESTLTKISSQLSNWITIKNELTVQLTPYMFFINTLLSGG
ncbi:hypothetical protein [Psychrobacter sp. Marseille-P5312]|uniref:hypothetical protein n=1 Tax=Psychrobacter sp. Marseille-P5312 TaxID=2086574 RepID=UPI000CF5DD3A|nr:hypothetical protein [Psychrobacter sp. Marseille-P5312]